MASGRPSNASPEAWYATARVVDQNRAANEAFTSTFQTPPLPPRSGPTPLPRPAVPVTKPVHAHLHPSPGNPIPMDLDSARNTLVSPKCFRCKLPGHFSNNCPSCHDARVRVSKYPGIKLNSKVVIEDNHLTLIYFTCGKTI